MGGDVGGRRERVHNNHKEAKYNSNVNASLTLNYYSRPHTQYK